MARRLGSSTHWTAACSGLRNLFLFPYFSTCRLWALDVVTMTNPAYALVTNSPCVPGQRTVAGKGGRVPDDDYRQ